MNIADFRLYNLIVKEDKGSWLKIVMAACLAGLLQGCIVVIINQAAGNITQGGLNLRYFFLFCVTIAAYGLASYFASMQTTKVTEQVLFSTYVGIADKIRHANTMAFESIGKSKIYTTLHTNTDIILESSKLLAGIGAAVVMILFCAVYIAMMSHSAILAIVIFYLFGVFVYVTNFKRARRLLDDANEQSQRFRGLFSYFLEGFKEIKVDEKKSKDLFINYIKKQSKQAKSSRIRSENQLTVNTVFVQSCYYIIIAMVIFLLPRITTIEPVVIVKIAVVVLFSYGSMTRIVMAIPLLLKSEHAIKNLDQLNDLLSQSTESAKPYNGQFLNLDYTKATINVQDIMFHYSGNEDSSAFSIGPANFEISPGQIIFITGSNGSGKTTLLKLLCGLYQPSQGNLAINGQRIDEKNYDDYRNLFSVIFSDYYIFDRFYGQQRVDDKLVNKMLTRLGLGDRLRWMDGQFSNLNVSAGQKKRLALILGYLDESPYLIMDEVAADLDPLFRKYFYEEFLQQLVSQGKTIIAVSHDDKYFSRADRLINIEQGKILLQ